MAAPVGRNAKNKMAIYQFYLYTIPSLETDIPINQDRNIIDQLEDAGRSFWSSSSIYSEDLVIEIDKLLPRSNWSTESWKINNGTIDNDASIDVLDGKLISFSFRSDLTEDGLRFLKVMLRICRKFDLNVFTLKGEFSEPKIESVSKLIKSSRNYQFLVNPIQFLDELDS